MEQSTKRITLATVKAFIRKNRAQLLISCRSRFDGMIDGCSRVADQSFSPAQEPEAGRNHPNTLGIAGAWFVFGSRDSLSAYNEGGYTGYRVYNSCGSFVLAVRAPQAGKALAAEHGVSL